MDYIDQLKQFAKRTERVLPTIKTEEATKTALILPFFQMLGYDVFNPVEFVPEFVADVGIKKGEKVDFAIMQDGQPVILIEAKSCTEELEKHDSQLFRYFGTTPAKLAILTNGIIYRFFTDLSQKNRMDLTPFMEINIFDIKDALVPELKRFQKTSLDVNTIADAASDLKYTTQIKEYLKKQATDPSKEFLAPIIKAMYKSPQTASVVSRFKQLYIASFAQYINELLNERFQSAIAANQEKNEVKDDARAEEQAEAAHQAIITTDEELEAFTIVKSLVFDLLAPDRISIRDTKSYMRIIVDDKVTRWFCAFILEAKNKYLCLPTNTKDWKRIRIEGTNDIYAHAEEIRQAAAVIANQFPPNAK